MNLTDVYQDAGHPNRLYYRYYGAIIKDGCKEMEE